MTAVWRLGTMRRSSLFLIASVFLASSLWSQSVIVRFDPSSQAIGPFPTDFQTIVDSTQKTGLRINLTTPDCGVAPSACLEVAALNQLDGFNLQPRVRISFSES